MPITTEMIVAIIGIATPLFGAAFWLGRWLDKKVKENIKSLQDQMASYTTERQRLLSERERVEQGLNARVAELERNTVTREDYLQDRETVNRAMDGIALALRESQATVTSRIDLVLFEINRNNRAKPDN